MYSPLYKMSQVSDMLWICALMGPLQKSFMKNFFFAILTGICAFCVFVLIKSGMFCVRTDWYSEVSIIHIMLIEAPAEEHQSHRMGVEFLTHIAT